MMSLPSVHPRVRATFYDAAGNLMGYEVQSRQRAFDLSDHENGTSHNASSWSQVQRYTTGTAARRLKGKDPKKGLGALFPLL